MTIRMNHDVYEIGIIERRNGSVECLIRKVPCRRPRLPQEPAECTTVHLQSGSTAFRIEVVLIPNSALGRRRGWWRRRNRVLDRITTDENGCTNEILMKSGGNARRPSTPIEDRKSVV